MRPERSRVDGDVIEAVDLMAFCDFGGDERFTAAEVADHEALALRQPGAAPSCEKSR